MSPVLGEKRLYLILFAIAALYLLSRYLGEVFFQNKWSFVSFSELPTWYKLAWPCLAIGILVATSRLTKSLALFDSKRNRLLLFFGTLGFIWLLSYDSFLFGGGNREIAKIAQMPDISDRFLSLLTYRMVEAASAVLSSLNFSANQAAAWGFRMLGLASVAAYIFGAIRMAGEHFQPNNRFAVFVILISGGLSVLPFFVGTEIVIAPFLLLFTHYSLLAIRGGSRLTALAIALVGPLFHAGLLVLLPGSAYLMIRGNSTGQNRRTLAIVSGILITIVLTALVYSATATTFAWKDNVLRIKPMPPVGDYGLFSSRHISDYFQMVWLVAPLAIGGSVLSVLSRSNNRMPGRHLYFLLIPTLLLAFILNPTNGIALDIPILAAYLIPLSVFTAFAFERTAEPKSRSCSIAAGLSLAFAMTYVPTYTKISLAEPYVAEYLRQQPVYFRETALAFRDTYFFSGNLEKASSWENILPINSPDYLLYRGSRDLVVHGALNDAIAELQLLVVGHPHWSEPRALLGTTHMRLNQLAPARAQFDTCLMLEPYRKEYLINDYSWFLQQNRLDTTSILLGRAAEFYPEDLQIEADRMIVLLKSGKLNLAEEMASNILVKDSTSPLPYYVRGMLAEQKGNLAEAENNYRAFLEFGKDHPEASIVAKRLSHVVLQQRE